MRSVIQHCRSVVAWQGSWQTRTTGCFESLQPAVKSMKVFNHKHDISRKHHINYDNPTQRHTPNTMTNTAHNHNASRATSAATTPHFIHSMEQDFEHGLSQRRHVRNAIRSRDIAILGRWHTICVKLHVSCMSSSQHMQVQCTEVSEMCRTQLFGDAYFPLCLNPLVTSCNARCVRMQISPHLPLCCDQCQFC